MSDEETAVFFDLDGTVLSLPGAYAPVVHDTTEAHLGGRDDAFEATYSERFLELLGEQAAAPYETAMAEALDAHGYDADAAAMAATLREHEVAAVAPPDGVEAALSALRDRGYRLGVLTNGVPAFQREKLDAHGLSRYFDAVVVSYEAGAHKPDSAPFELAAERLPATEHVMVGDSHGADVEGARAMGWRAVHYAPGGESPDAGSADDADPIATFDALPERLD